MMNPPAAILPGLYRHDDDTRLVEVEPPRPCPFVMTSDEVIRFCRLDDLRNPEDVLYQHRKAGRLKGFQLGRSIRYLQPDVMEFLRNLVQAKPR